MKKRVTLLSLMFLTLNGSEQLCIKEPKDLFEAKDSKPFYRAVYDRGETDCPLSDMQVTHSLIGGLRGGTLELMAHDDAGDFYAFDLKIKSKGVAAFSLYEKDKDGQVGYSTREGLTVWKTFAIQDCFASRSAMNVKAVHVKTYKWRQKNSLKSMKIMQDFMRSEDIMYCLREDGVLKVIKRGKQKKETLLTNVDAIANGKGRLDHMIAILSKNKILIGPSSEDFKPQKIVDISTASTSEMKKMSFIGVSLLFYGTKEFIFIDNMDDDSKQSMIKDTIFSREDCIIGNIGFSQGSFAFIKTNEGIYSLWKNGYRKTRLVDISNLFEFPLPNEVASYGDKVFIAKEDSVIVRKLHTKYLDQLIEKRSRRCCKGPFERA
ncbi:hypothetical protein K9K77_00630 [Candidatus Babeliales bacterium]|nr:hypothetical protein [Candidatus Babeliales bacterium]